MTSISILDYSITGFGGLFCLVWAVGLALLTPERVDRTAILFVSTSGIRLLWESYFLSGLALSRPALYGPLLPLMYFIGPVLFMYYERLADRPHGRFMVLHFVTPVLAALPLYYWIPLDAHTQTQWLTRLYAGPRSLADWLFVGWVIGPKLSIFIYSLWIPLRKSYEGVSVFQNLPPVTRWFAGALLIYVWIMITVDMAGYCLGASAAFRYSAWSHSIAAIIVYWFSRVHPSAMLEFTHAIRQARYTRSKLAGLDVPTMLARLDDLMRREAYYADEDLRLSTLADALQISAHQLSELVNTRLKMSFSSFINYHRIQAARRMLLESDRNILSIALAVGFNSKSSFNRAFKQFSGVSPSQYRREKISQPDEISEAMPEDTRAGD